MKKISAVYKIVNEVTGDFYVGSSKNVYKRWVAHKCPSTWKHHPNNKMYLDMQKCGVDKFRFQILCPAMPEYLKQVEQELVEMIHPTYNDRNAKGLNIERSKEHLQSDKGKEVRKKANKKYNSQLCLYNGETLTLKALLRRFQRARIEHATLEAKKYILNGSKHFMNTIR